MKIVGLCGAARVGKDTAAKYFLKVGWKRFAFADLLKKDLNQLVGLLGLDLFRLDPDQKEKIRPLLVAWGATARAFEPNFWIRRLFDRIWLETVSSDQVVITDVRYPNEVKEILRRTGQVIRIHRPGFHPANDEERIHLEQIDNTWKLPVVNNNGTEDELGVRVYAEIKF